MMQTPLILFFVTSSACSLTVPRLRIATTNATTDATATAPEFSMSARFSFSPQNFFPGLLACALLCGCSGGDQATSPPALKSPAMTDQIGEFDPNAGLQVVTPEAKVTDPLTGPLEILKKEQIQLPTLQIEHALNLYNATAGNYPPSHEIFMREIIQANRLALPQLPPDLQYQYDVANHKLLIVRAADGKIVE